MLKPRTRVRQEILLPKSAELGRTTTYLVRNGVRVSTIGTTVQRTQREYLQRIERCVDQTGHLHFLSKKSGVKGGPLDLRRTYVENPISPFVKADSSNQIYGYEGQFLAAGFPDVTTTLPFETARSEVAASGATAWNRFRPGRPLVDLGVAIGEIRELPRLLKDTCSRLRDLHRGLRSLGKNPMALPYEVIAKKGGRQAAQDFLSYQFGWLPFLRDLRSTYQTSKVIDRSLREIRANNGKVRRRGGIVTRTSEMEVLKEGQDWTCLYPVLSSYLYASPPQVHRVRYSASRIWFKGAFRYWIPDVGTLQWKRRTTRLLYGLTVNAEILWNLIPWSWLVDWFSNVGDVMSSLDTGWADNLTAKYAYVMGSHSEVITQQSRVALAGGSVVDFVTHRVAESKQRVGASPFGFAVSYGSLSLRQLAILTALGVSRLRAPSFFQS